MDNMQDTVYQFSDQIFTPLRRFRGSESFQLSQMKPETRSRYRKQVPIPKNL